MSRAIFNGEKYAGAITPPATIYAEQRAKISKMEMLFTIISEILLATRDFQRQCAALHMRQQRVGARKKSFPA